ncbi:MAG: HAD-IIIA family hydrolase [Bacteroidota bacterium]|nr:HAD-IIIA family hydrolase [Bacteroidota bacterium]
MKIDNRWTLFLDRDGVINRRIVGSYVTKWSHFEFLPGVLDAFRILAGIFPRIFVVSNQQGVGKGIMTDEEVAEIHRKMVDEIAQSGGRIDRVYYCPNLESDHSKMRKPASGMALLAQHDFPEVDFQLSLMAGDSISDMEFGKRLKMITVSISPFSDIVFHYKGLIDRVYPDLLTFAKDMASQVSIP